MTEPDMGRMTWAMARIQHGARVAGVPLNSTWDDLVEGVEYKGNVTGLEFIANGWSTEIRGAVSAAHNELNESVRTVTAAWTGSAATDFNTYVGRLDSAFAVVLKACDEIADAVRSLKTGVVIFWGAAIVFAVQTASAVATCLALALPSVGFSLSGVWTAIAAFLGAVAVLIGGLFVFVDSIDDSVSELQRYLVEQDSLPNGRWPRPSELVVGGGDWKIN